MSRKFPKPDELGGGDAVPLGQGQPEPLEGRPEDPDASMSERDEDEDAARPAAGTRGPPPAASRGWCSSLTCLGPSRPPPASRSGSRSSWSGFGEELGQGGVGGRLQRVAGVAVEELGDSVRRDSSIALPCSTSGVRRLLGVGVRGERGARAEPFTRPPAPRASRRSSRKRFVSAGFVVLALAK